MSALPATASATSTDTAAAIAVGVLAATLATLAHETLGHGLACIGVGGHITLLTSIWFRCSKWSAIANAGGPIGNLIAGSAALALLGHGRPGPRMRLLLLMVGALSLFCFMGQLALESLTNNHDDWYSTALLLGWPPIWRPVGAVVGIGGYLLVRRWLATLIRRRRAADANAIRLAYGAAAASAVIAGLLWRPEPFQSAVQGFLAFGVAPLGLLGLARSSGGAAGRDVGNNAAAGTWIWISVCAVVFGLFLLVQATGLGPMAGSGLPP